MVTTPNRPDQFGPPPEYVPPTYTPVPPVKKPQAWKWIGAAVVVLLLVGIASTQNDTQGTGSPNGYSNAPAISETDVLQQTLNEHPEYVVQFCDGYTTLKAAGLTDSEIFSTVDASGSFDALEGTGISSYELFSAMAGRC